MTIERKVGMGIAGQPSGDAANVADVFSTYVYAGNGTNSNVINNGIDLAGEGGMVWVKNRSSTDAGIIVDTERGIQKQLTTSSTSAENTDYRDIESFNSNGFTARYWSNATNHGDYGYASWTFRKKEKFFDIVTYTGNYVAGREISHGLAGPVGMMIIKCLSNNEDWAVYHRRANGGVNPQNFKLILNNASAAASGYWNNTAPTDSSFTVGQAGEVNGNNQTYVAYLFADNSSELADNQMIKCGSYTGNGSATGPVVNLGWEPQFLITKVVNSNNWHMWDSMRGITAGSDDARLYPNLTNAEDKSEKLQLTSTGFQIKSSSASINTSGVETIYMAIRAPMMVKPEAATDVFAMDLGTGSVPSFISGFPVDMAFNATYASAATHKIVGTRLTSGRYLDTTVNGAEANEGHNTFDFMNGWNKDSRGSAYFCWMWKRAKGYFDVVAYKGSGSPRTLAHSLGVVPEMIVCKSRSTTGGWQTYHKTTGNTKYLYWNQNYPAQTSSSVWNNTTPTDSVFTVGNGGELNGNNITYIAYLFSTLAGISKVGSYTGNGADERTINCGFSAGSRFILIKRTNTNGDWYFWDSVRGINSGNEPRLSLNTNATQVTNNDSVNPHNSGFNVNQVAETNLNVSGSTYIFYAIA